MPSAHLLAANKYHMWTDTEYKIAVEPVTLARIDLAELAEQHYQEVNFFRDRPLDINWDSYTSADQTGHYHLITARHLDQLIGWAGYFVYEHMRHRGYQIAREDWYYVKPQYRNRGIGRSIFTAAESTLRQRGVDRIIMSCKTTHDYTDLIQDLGYQQHEKNFTKALNRDEI
jgi:GNAT superfamily N-acetyltransferase